MRRAEFTWEMPSCPSMLLSSTCWGAALLKCTQVSALCFIFLAFGQRLKILLDISPPTEFKANAVFNK